MIDNEQYNTLLKILANVSEQVNYSIKLGQEALAEVRALAKEVQVLRSDVEILKEDVRILKEDVQILKEDVRILKKEVRVLKKDVAVLKEDVITIKEDIHALQGAVHQLETNQPTFYDILADMAQSISDNVLVKKIRKIQRNLLRPL